MIYKLKFTPSAQKDWDSLDNSVKQQLKKVLIKRLENPFIPKDRLYGTVVEAYKIKLITLGIRLIYTVVKNELSLAVVAVGKRENDEVYESINKKLLDLPESSLF